MTEQNETSPIAVKKSIPRWYKGLKELSLMCEELRRVTGILDKNIDQINKKENELSKMI